MRSLACFYFMMAALFFSTISCKQYQQGVKSKEDAQKAANLAKYETYRAEEYADYLVGQLNSMALIENQLVFCRGYERILHNGNDPQSPPAPEQKCEDFEAKEATAAQVKELNVLYGNSSYKSFCVKDLAGVTP